MNKMLTVGVFLAAVAAVAICFAPSFAQDKPAAAVTPVAKEVTITGKLVDVFCFVAGCPAKEDPAKCCAECIKNGVPAAIETPTGLVLVGQGTKGCAKLLEPLAMANVEAKGKIYEKGGLKYLDIIEIKKAADKPADKPVAKPTDKPVAKPIDKPEVKPTDKPVPPKPIDKPVPPKPDEKKP